MQVFHGEYECKVDAKGRFRMPAQLIKQLDGAEQEPFFLNRGLEKCLVLYPNQVWQRITKEVNNLNLYVEANRKFARYFYRGATELTIDKSDRLLLPKSLATYAAIDKDMIVFAYSDRIELWSKENYEAMMDEEPDEFVGLAEEVMGKLSNQPDA